MFIADAVGAITGVLAGADEMVVDPDTLAKVRKLLKEAVVDLTEAQDRMHGGVSASSVGRSYWGGQLSHHSLLAHDRLLETIADLNAGLDSYEVAMLSFEKGASSTDEANTAVLKKGDAYVGDATTPSNG